MTDAVPIALDGYVVYARADDVGIGQVIAAGIDYEPHVVPAFLEHLREGGCVLDIGANIGYFAMLAAHRVGPAGRVIAVEPVDKNVQLLCRAIVHNGFTNVEILPFAASDQPGILAVETHALTSNAEMHSGAARDQAGGFAIAKPLDPWLASLARLDVVKIDVEGFEPLALRGMDAALRRHRPAIFSEFHPQALRRNGRVEPEAYLARLFEHSPVLQVLGRDGSRRRWRSADEVMHDWQQSNEAVGMDGLMHLDLLSQPE